MLNRANARAARTSLRRACRTHSSARPFQCPGGEQVPAPSFHFCAIASCSPERLSTVRCPGSLGDDPCRRQHPGAHLAQRGEHWRTLCGMSRLRDEDRGDRRVISCRAIENSILSISTVTPNYNRLLERVRRQIRQRHQGLYRCRAAPTTSDCTGASGNDAFNASYYATVT